MAVMLYYETRGFECLSDDSMLQPIAVIARLTLLEARLNRLFWLLLIVLIAAVSLAEFMGALAITESAQVQAAVLGTVLRASAVVVVSLFVISSGVRELNDKGTEFVLSMAIPRASYYLGKLLGFSLFACLAAGLLSLALVLYVPITQVLYWALSMSCELLLVTAFSLLCLVTFRQITVALSAVLAFYVLARTVATIQLIGRGPLVEPGTLSQQLMNGLIDAIAFVLPSLERFAPSEWLVYHTGDWQDLTVIMGQTAVYLLLLSGAALFDLYRRSF